MKDFNEFIESLDKDTLISIVKNHNSLGLDIDELIEECKNNENQSLGLAMNIRLNCLLMSAQLLSLYHEWLNK